MIANYVEYHKHLEERVAQLGRELPGPNMMHIGR